MESPNRPNNADPLLFRYVATAEESNQPSVNVVLSVQGALIGGQIISAALYPAKGLWYDALSTAATLRSVKPEDETLKADWLSLLRSVGLETIAAEPLAK
jgi:hypothetical protein